MNAVFRLLLLLLGLSISGSVIADTPAPTADNGSNHQEIFSRLEQVKSTLTSKREAWQQLQKAVKAASDPAQKSELEANWKKTGKPSSNWSTLFGKSPAAAWIFLPLPLKSPRNLTGSKN